MSDGLTEAWKGFASRNNLTPEQQEEEHKKEWDFYYDHQLEKIPIEYIERYIRKKKLNNIEPDKVDNI